MLELPEMITIRRQMSEVLPGKLIEQVTLLASPHKFAFLNHDTDRYETHLQGQSITMVESRGNYVILHLQSGESLVLGDMGGRILYHSKDTTLPVKHQLKVAFKDKTWLTATIQMWGAILLLTPSELQGHSRIKHFSPSPLEDGFTFEHFMERIHAVPEEEMKSVKFFIISQFGLPGVGNGCLHDILFNAKINPRKPLAMLDEEQRYALWQSARKTLGQMTDIGGRSSEHDLFDQPGKYDGILSNESTGKPCPVCGTPIQRVTYLGGASFFCPSCQPE